MNEIFKDEGQGCEQSKKQRGTICTQFYEKKYCDFLMVSTLKSPFSGSGGSKSVKSTNLPRNEASSTSFDFLVRFFRRGLPAEAIPSSSSPSFSSSEVSSEWSSSARALSDSGKGSDVMPRLRSCFRMPPLLRCANGTLNPLYRSWNCRSRGRCVCV